MNDNINERLVFGTVVEANQYLTEHGWEHGHARFDCSICGDYISNMKCMSSCQHPWILVPCKKCVAKRNDSINRPINAIENIIDGLDNNLSDNTLQTIRYLTTALADEWLAYYQYWTCANTTVSLDKMGDVKFVKKPFSEIFEKSSAVFEFKQHATDEKKHADMLVKRIVELGGKITLTNPAEWQLIGNDWEEVKTNDVHEQLKITIRAEEGAIAFYKKVMDYVKDFDETTAMMLESIIKDEEEHKNDLLKILIDEHMKTASSVTLAQVNAKLKSMGVPERLFKGRGYYYFSEGEAMSWKSSSVPVYNINELTLDEWIKEYLNMKDEYEKQYKPQNPMKNGIIKLKEKNF